MATPRVLVVDDDAVARQYLAEVLHALGAHVDLADSGTRGHALATAHPYDLLVVDRRLPDIDAAAWLQVLRAQTAARSQSVPAIVHSAALRAADRARLLAAGYLAAYDKPIPCESLATQLGVPAATGRSTPDSRADRVREATAAPVLDDEAGLQACGTREILDGLRQLLRAELAQHRHDLLEAAARDDGPSIAALAHRLHGAARFCGTPALVAALRQIDSGTDETVAATLGPVLAAIDTLVATLARVPD
ncbi:MAG: response regulator [Xanthomonadales bacterium]|nr:response regulator [Xanthomonadales bacterium]